MLTETKCTHTSGQSCFYHGGKRDPAKKIVVVIFNVILHIRFFGQQPMSSYLVVALSIVLSVAGLTKLG
jgi:hypothetical protein